MDIRALAQAMMPHFQKSVEGFAEGRDPKPMDEEAINKDLAELPEGPDEALE